MSATDRRFGRGLRRLNGAFAALLMLVLAANIVPVPASRAQTAALETGTLDVRVEKGFARLIFTFTRRPRLQITSNTGVLVLRFDRPVDVPLEALGQNLRSAIPTYRIDADHTAIRMALNRKFRINTSEAGEQIFVDLLPEPWKGALPELPPEVLAEMARQAEEAERRKREDAERQQREATRGPVAIVESDAPTFSRLEFQWQQKPSAIVKRNQSETQITFDGIGVFEEHKARARLPHFIEGIDFAVVDYRSVVTLKINPERDVRSFVDGNSFVLDVVGQEIPTAEEKLAGGTPAPRESGQGVIELQGEQGGEAVTDPPPAAKRGAASVPPAPKKPAEPAVAEATPPATVAEAASPPPAAQESKKEPGPKKEPEVKKEPAPAREATARNERSAPVPLPRPNRPSTSIPPAPAPEPVVEVTPADQATNATVTVKNRNDKPEKDAGASTEPVVVAPPADKTREVAKSGLQVTGDYLGNLARIDFAFPKAVPAAIFLRGSTLWLVFESPLQADLETALSKVRRIVRRIDTEKSGDRQIIRLLVDDANLVAAEADGTTWRVYVGDAPPNNSIGLEVKPRYTADGRAALYIEAKDGLPALRLTDPIVGDRLTIVPLRGPSAGVAKTQRFVDADLLRTVHGVAIKENVDDLTTRIEKEAIIVERDSGLALSSLASTRANLQTPSDAPELRPGFVDFEGWKLGPVNRFLAIRQDLIKRAATSEGPERTSARLDLARFYLSYQLGNEAMSLLNYAAGDDALIERDKSFRLLRGISAVLSRRFDAADRDLNDPEFDDSPDVALWRGLQAYERSDWGKARRFIRMAHPVLEQYPRPLQKKALLALAEAQLELGDIGGMEILLDEIASLDRNSASKAQIALLHGRYAEMLGRVEPALADYSEATRNAPPRTETEAMLRYTELASKIGTMPRDQAAENLTRVSFAWRGDAIELKARQLLARFAIERGDYRDAFTLARGAAAAAPASPITLAIQDEARDAFASLFLESKPVEISAVDRLALFYDFQELVPSGRKGDEMIRKLAGRLVDVDLLDQSIELLAFQVDKRLTGAARAEVAGQLAFIHLLNREPAKALEVLKRTRQSQLASNIERQRNLVEARALAAVGRGKLAVELLSDEKGAEFKRLKADLLWESKDYAEAGLAIEEALGDIWKTKEPLSEVQRADVLRAAVAQALAGDQTAVDRLRQHFGPLMNGTTDAVTFNVLTGRIETQGTEFRQIARNVASVNTLEAFLKEYRDKYRPGGAKNDGEPRADAAAPAPRG